MSRDKTPGQKVHRCSLPAYAYAVPAIMPSINSACLIIGLRQTGSPPPFSSLPLCVKTVRWKKGRCSFCGTSRPRSIVCLVRGPRPRLPRASQPDQGLFDALEESSIAVPDCGTMPWWADAQLCEMSKGCGGACSAWWALGTRALLTVGWLCRAAPSVSA